jgi:hypothetical protein
MDGSPSGPPWAFCKVIWKKLLSRLRALPDAIRFASYAAEALVIPVLADDKRELALALAGALPASGEKIKLLLTPDKGG